MTKERYDVYSHVTNQIVAQIELLLPLAHKRSDSVKDDNDTEGDSCHADATSRDFEQAKKIDRALRFVVFGDRHQEQSHPGDHDSADHNGNYQGLKSHPPIHNQEIFRF